MFWFDFDKLQNIYFLIKETYMICCDRKSTAHCYTKQTTTLTRLLRASFEEFDVVWSCVWRWIVGFTETSYFYIDGKCSHFNDSALWKDSIPHWSACNLQVIAIENKSINFFMHRKLVLNKKKMIAVHFSNRLSSSHWIEICLPQSFEYTEEKHNMNEVEQCICISFMLHETAIRQ